MNYSMQTIGALQIKISTEEKLPLPYAAVLAENALYRFDERVQEGVVRWLNKLLDEDFAVGGISVGEIQHEIGGSVFQALCVMDIYVKNPDFIPVVLWNEMYDSIETTGVDLPARIEQEET